MPAQVSIFDELIVDYFAGGGGASLGIEMATGRPVDIAINHDQDAIEMHKRNHPFTKHYQEDVWKVDPMEATKGRPVGLAWFSPDCKHFSKAKGGKPVNKKIRGLAWVCVHFAAKVRPRVIMLENVEEFKTWGPLVAQRDKATGRVLKRIKVLNEKGEKVEKIAVAEKSEVVPYKQQVFQPDPAKKGKTFEQFVTALENLGYIGDWNELKACDYSAPTIRKRLFGVFRRDNKPVVWPKATHGKKDSLAVINNKLKPYRAAAEIIDWSLPCPSIFDRKKPLAEATLKRIAKGLRKFIFENPEPFIIGIGQNGFSGEQRVYSIHEPLRTIVTKQEHCLVAPTLLQYHSEKTGKEVRGQSVADPLYTLDTQPRYAMVQAFLLKYYDGNYQGSGSDLREPLSTVTTIDHNSLVTSHLEIFRNGASGGSMSEPLNTVLTSPGHFAGVRAFLIKYYGQGCGQGLTEPLHTITSKDRIGLVTIYGQDYMLVDIGLRMLQPHELFAAQGFFPDYIFDVGASGRKLSKAAQTAKAGNSVSPVMSEVLVRANLPELCINRVNSMQELLGQMAL